MKRLKQYKLMNALKQGKVLCGMNIGTPVPAFVEMIGYSGFDYVYIDTEHTIISLQELSQMIASSELANIPAIVRVPDNDAPNIRKVLEIGAEGVIVPHVNTREDALKAIQAAKFPPEGIRGFGSTVRSYKFGMSEDNITTYIRNSNEGTTVIVQPEEKEALENIEEIASAQGLGGILIGPYDLSFDMGLPGQFTAPAVKGSVEKIMEVGKRQGVPIMITITHFAKPVTVESVRLLIEKGVRLITFGSVEAAIKTALSNTMENIVKKIR